MSLINRPWTLINCIFKIVLNCIAHNGRLDWQWSICIVLLLFLFVTLCSLFEWKWICAGHQVVFIYHLLLIFILHWWNWWPSLFKLSFHNYKYYRKSSLSFSFRKASYCKTFSLLVLSSLDITMQWVTYFTFTLTGNTVISK